MSFGNPRSTLVDKENGFSSCNIKTTLLFKSKCYINMLGAHHCMVKWWVHGTFCVWNGDLPHKGSISNIPNCGFTVHDFTIKHPKIVQQTVLALHKSGPEKEHYITLVHQLFIFLKTHLAIWSIISNNLWCSSFILLHSKKSHLLNLWHTFLLVMHGNT